MPPWDANDGLFIDDQVSSPSNGAHTIEEEGYFSTDSGSPLYGDIHFYMYDKVNKECFFYPWLIKWRDALFHFSIIWIIEPRLG